VYLGNVIGEGELNIDPTNTKVILKWPMETSYTEIRSFVRDTKYFKKIHSIVFSGCNNTSCYNN
jgi:hypothetical protein